MVSQDALRGDPSGDPGRCCLSCCCTACSGLFAAALALSLDLCGASLSAGAGELRPAGGVPERAGDPMASGWSCSVCMVLLTCEQHKGMPDAARLWSLKQNSH